MTQNQSEEEEEQVEINTANAIQLTQDVNTIKHSPPLKLENKSPSWLIISCI